MRKAMVVRAGRAIGNDLVERLIKIGMDVITQENRKRAKSEGSR